VLGILAFANAQWGFVLLEVVWGGVSAWGLLTLTRASSSPRH